MVIVVVDGVFVVLEMFVEDVDVEMFLDSLIICYMLFGMI